MNNGQAIPSRDAFGWKAVLRDLARQLSEAGIPYTVVGGTSLALHGLNVKVKDIDIETSTEGLYRCASLWAAYVLGKAGYSSGEHYRSHFARFLFSGVQVELMARLEWREDKRWLPVHTSTVEIVDLDGVPINVSWLEEETLAYIRRGRLDRAARCLERCDQQRLLRLLRGEQITRVLG